MLCSQCHQSADALCDGGLCVDCHMQSEHRKIIELARQQQPAEVQFDDDARLSQGNDNGCYMQAWVWVDFAGTNFDKQKVKTMTQTSKEECLACGGRGWLFCNTGNDPSRACQIQRCDACETFQNDLAALETVVKAAEAQPNLLRFIERVSQLTHEGEPGDDGQPYEPSSEDTIAALNEIIMEARQLLGIAEKCSQCGRAVPYVIGCPDGAEVCRDCFEEGRH